MSLIPYMNTTEGLQCVINTLAERGGPFSKDEIKIIGVFRASGYGSIRILDHPSSMLILLATEILEKALESYNNLETHYSPTTVLCLQFELAKRKTCTSPKS